MRARSLGLTLLAALFLVAGLAGIFISWTAWPRSSATSPLMTSFALAWGCTYVVTAILTWRRSRLAAPMFVAAIGLVLFPANFVLPERPALLPSLAVIALVACLGYRYLRDHASRGFARVGRG